MKVNIPKDFVPAIELTVKTIDYDYVCNDRKVLPYLKMIVSAGVGKLRVKAFPAELVARLNQSFERRTDEAVISEMPKYFPGSRVISVNDSPDFIAEGGAFKEQLVELYTSAKDLTADKAPAVYYHHNELGWLIVAASSDVNLKDLTEFIEVNTDRWAELANGDQLPGGGNEDERQFPVSALPGTEEAKRPFPKNTPKPSGEYVPGSWKTRTNMPDYLRQSYEELDAAIAKDPEHLKKLRKPLEEQMQECYLAAYKRINGVEYGAEMD